MSVDQTIKNFMEKCHRKCGFRIPAVYSHYVTMPLDSKFIDAVIYHNNIDMVGAYTTVKHLIKFLYRLKTIISEIVVKDYFAEVFNRLDYMDQWSFDKQAFEFCEQGNLKKLSHIEQSVTVCFTSRHLSTVNIHFVWDRIYEGLFKNHKDVLATYHMFTREVFPKDPFNISFYDDKCQLFLK